MIVPRKRWVDELTSRFPDFVASTPGWDPDADYLAFGAFATYIRDRILASGVDDVVLRAFALINEMAEVKDIAVENLVVVGFLEVLCDQDVALKAAKAHLEGRAKALLDEYLRWPATPL